MANGTLVTSEDLKDMHKDEILFEMWCAVSDENLIGFNRCLDALITRLVPNYRWLVMENGWKQSEIIDTFLPEMYKESIMRCYTELQHALL